MSIRNEIHARVHYWPGVLASKFGHKLYRQFSKAALTIFHAKDQVIDQLVEAVMSKVND